MLYSDLNDACKSLLLTVVGTLNKTKLRYVIAGGWVPLLIESDHPYLKHPGTRDVDVLLVDNLESVRLATRALFENDFRPSAKHEFQLLRNASVGKQEFVFNVDLMHPVENSEPEQMFNDIFDLGVRDDYDPRGSRFAKSIAFRSAKIVYEKNLFTNIPLLGIDLDENTYEHSIPLLSASAFILSKCESVKIKKRTRDAFDIYYMLSSSNGRKHASELVSLSQNYRQVHDQVNILLTFLRDESMQFNYNVNIHAHANVENAANFCFDVLRDVQ